MLGTGGERRPIPLNPQRREIRQLALGGLIEERWCINVFNPHQEFWFTER